MRHRPPTTGLDTGWLTRPHSGLLVAVLGDLTDPDRPSSPGCGTGRLPARGRPRRARLDPRPRQLRGASAGAATGASTGATGQSVGWLTSNGWRAVDAGPQDSVPSVWQELGAAGRAGAGGPRTFSDGTPGRAPENIS